MSKPTEHFIDDDAVHGWFGLTYASYLVMPRSVLQSMPQEWQQRFVQCLREIEETIDWESLPPMPSNYVVMLKDHVTGKWLTQDDPYRQYERGRRQLPLKNSPA